MCKAFGLFVLTVGLLFSPLSHAATSTWTGLGIDANWTTGQNWQGNTAPSAGDDLVFPNGAAQTTNTNDFTAGTSFNSITFGDTTGYTITGNSIVLTGGANALSSNAGANSLGLAITFGTAAPTIECLAGTGLTLSGNLANGGFLLTFDCSAPITVSGVISGTGGLDEDSGSSSLLTLSGANNYSGATTIDAGTLSAQNATALGTLGTTVNSGAVLQLDGGITVSQPLILNGMGSGSGALVNGTGANTWTGNITLTSSSFIGADAGSLALTTGAFSLGINDLTFLGAGAILVTQVISGSGNVKVAGVGGVTVTLNAASTYTGNTSVSVGTLIAGSDVVSSVNGPFGNSSAAVQVGSSFNATLQVAGSMFARPINVTGSGSALIVGNAFSDISGAITVASPLGLALGTNGTPTSVSGTINNGGFPLSFQPLTGQTMTVSGAISGSGPLTCDAPGIAILSSAANAYTGSVTVNSGTIRVNAAGAIPATTDVAVAAGASFDLNNNSVTVDSIAGLGSISLGTGTLTVASTAPPAVFDGIISGVGGQLKLSSGTLTLTGTNTYTGATTVNGGVLSIDGTQGGSAVAVNSGAVLQGTGTVGAVTVTGGGLGVGDPQTAASTFNAGAVSLNAATLFKLNLSGFVAGSSMDQLNCSGALTVAGTLNLNLMGLAAPGTAAGIITYTSSSGAFNNVTLNNNANNYGATLNFKATALDIQFSAALPAPTLNVASDSGATGDGITNIKTPAISGTGANAGATITIMDGATTLGTATANGSGNWTFTCPSLADGLHVLAATQAQFGGLSAPLSIAIDTAAPTLTIAQQTGQTDPATTLPVKFLVTASEPLATFGGNVVQLSGTAGATTATVTALSASQYEVDVSGAMRSGTVIIDLPASAVSDVAGNPSVAATIMDNAVTYSIPPGPGPVASFMQSSDQVASGQSDMFDGDPSTVTNGTLTYLWDFGDGSPTVTGELVTHTFTSPFDTSFTTTLTVTDSAGLQATTSKTINVLTANSGGTATESVLSSLNLTIVADSNVRTQINLHLGVGQTLNIDLAGAITAGVGVRSSPATVSPASACATIPLNNGQIATRCESRAVTIRGIILDKLPRKGFRAAPTESATVHGFSPTFKFVNSGVAVVRSSLLDANNASVAILRKTVTISEREVGPGTHFTTSAVNRSITVIKTAGNFNFSRNTAASTRVKADKVSFSGTFELPAGMDLSQPQEFQFAIGNVIDAVQISPKGKSTRAGVLQNIQKVQISLPRVPKGQTTTSTGMKAKVTLTISNTGLSTAGFESDDITNSFAPGEAGKKSVTRGVQVGMVYAGESYQLVAPVTYKLNSTSTTGVMSGRSGL